MRFFEKSFKYDVQIFSFLRCYYIEGHAAEDMLYYTLKMPEGGRVCLRCVWPWWNRKSRKHLLHFLTGTISRI